MPTLFAGVLWQYKLPPGGAAAAVAASDEAAVEAAGEATAEVDRLHAEVNMLTRSVEAEAGKIKDPVEQDRQGALYHRLFPNFLSSSNLSWRVPVTTKVIPLMRSKVLSS